MSSSFSNDSNNNLIGYEEAAQILGIAKGTLYAWVSEGRIGYVRFSPRCVRFQRAVLEAYVQERVVPVAATCGAANTNVCEVTQQRKRA